MSKRRLLVVAGLLTGLLAAPGVASAEQTDYSAGKSAAQLFSSDCVSCHQSPKGLAKARDQRGLTDFLREHYTTRSENAGALAAYLVGNPGTAAPIRNPTEAGEPRGRQPKNTPASASAPVPAAAPAAAQAPRPAATEEDPFRRIFGLGQSEPEQKPIVAPEPGEETAAKPEQKGKGKAKARTAARPAAEPAARAGKDEPKETAKDTAKETPKEAPKSRKVDQPTEAARDAAKGEDAAKEAVAKAEAARVRAYATSGDEARQKEAAPAPAVAPAAEKPAPPPG